MSDSLNPSAVEGVRPEEDTVVEPLRDARPDVARLVFELNKTVGHGGLGSVFNEELRDPEDLRDFRRRTAADRVAHIKGLFITVLMQRAAFRVQRRTERIENPEEVGGAAINLLQERREQFYSGLKTWVEERFNALPNGAYEAGIKWPYVLKDSTIIDAASKLLDFAEFQLEENVLKGDVPFQFERLSDVAHVRNLLDAFADYLLYEKEPIIKMTAARKRRHEHTTASAQQKELANISLSPATVKSVLFGTICSLRLLNVVHPDRGTHALLTKGQIDLVGAQMEKNVGAVAAFNTRPLFFVDLEQAFEKCPPTTMTELSYFLQACAHVHFGSRKSTLYPGKGEDQTGILIGHVKSIAYSQTHNKYLIRIALPCFDKTRRNPFYQ